MIAEMNMKECGLICQQTWRTGTGTRRAGSSHAGSGSMPNPSCRFFKFWLLFFFLQKKSNFGPEHWPFPIRCISSILVFTIQSWTGQVVVLNQPLARSNHGKSSSKPHSLPNYNNYYIKNLKGSKRNNKMKNG